ncbi:MAG TPA: T9SS type A sorting domain-containing protein [Bacteroidia bacterium]|nr:T9SS type A sorting domain-containing protein [Bacteroidia bacterium]
MKKILLCITAFCACVTFNEVAAQTSIYTQNFESGMPATWHQEAATQETNLGWKVGLNMGSGTLGGGGYVPAHTHYAYVNDYDNNTTNHSNKDSLYTQSIDMSTYTHVFISFDYLFWQNYNVVPGDLEQFTLAYSSNGGTSWTMLDSLGGTSIWNTRTFDISSVAGKSNIMLCFAYTNGGKQGYMACLDNVNIYEPEALDLGVTAMPLNYYLQKNTPYTISGTVHNYGSTIVTTMNVKYSINGGAAVSTTISSPLWLQGLANCPYSIPTPWTPTTAGTYTVKAWTDNPNGSADQAHANDTLSTTVQVLDSVIDKFPLFEEFNQASCDPCAQATPHLDSILSQSQSICNAVRYHVSWPGQDFMNQVTNGPFVGPRVSYYSVSGVPDAKLDGSTDVYPGGITVDQIITEAHKGSPFQIDITSSTYNAVTNTYNVAASITAYGAMPTGLRAFAALTVDTITYMANQSTESIPQFVFPQVVEDMMPSSAGTALTAFTSGQTQPLNLTWVKNHPWGASPAVHLYDSTSTFHVTIWVQSNTSKYVYQSASYPRAAASTLGIVEQSELLNTIRVYPNPNNGDATISFELKQDANVKLDIFNSMGQLIRSTNKGNQSSGTHLMNLDGQDLPSGMYFINLTAGGHTVSKKVSIIR